MNKILIGIIVAIFGASIIGLIIFVIFLNSTQTPPNTNQGNTTGNNLPSSNPSTVTVGTGGNTTGQTGIGFTLSTSDGSTIVANDPKKDSAVKEDTVNKGYFYFNQNSSASSTENASYTIEYIEKTQFFNVVLNKEPIGQAREAAQTYLAQHLGISQTELCRLNYMVTVPYSVNQDFASIDLRFSPCPDATPL